MNSTNSVRKLVCAIFMLCVVNDALAQSETTAQVRCPNVSVSCVGENHCTQSPFYFVASVTQADPNQKFSYHWTVARAVIIAGQGTSMIKVDGMNGLVATVELRGLPGACKNVSATMASIWDPPPPVRKIDEFGSINFQKVRPHLDEFASQLQNTPGSTGSIVSTRKWRFAKNAIDYLSSKHGIPSERILIVDQKKKGPLLVKLYIVPPGAVRPG